MTLAVLIAAPSGLSHSSVTIDTGPASVLFRGVAPLKGTEIVGVNQNLDRSCEARNSKSVQSKILDKPHKAAVVACEQPPRSSLNLASVKNTAVNAIAADG